ncbi:hypothetical protein BGZ93_009325 [Podila epicladia]|nr:hypothetical protein BGZ92_008683 [Podila epicladia]KAG0090400.1 hypothetical protein BGZ93_009325 [Podila epicladia]
MVPSDDTVPHAYQNFTHESEGDDQIPCLPIRVCPETGKHYLLWADIQDAFVGVSHLLSPFGSRVLFMIGHSEELYIPLRIEHSADEVYAVIRNNQCKGDSTGIGHLFPIAQLFETTLILYRQLKDNVDKARNIFQQYAANTRHHHSLFAEEIQSMDQAGAKAFIDGKDQWQMLEQLQSLERQVPELNYRNTCRNTLQRLDNRWDYATSNLFVVLPSDPDTWDDSDHLTHQFRLHFLCDTGIPYGALKGIPQYIHLANHPGYKLKKPQEFFAEFGDYILRVLQLIKHGYSSDVNEIRPLETSLILLGCDPDVIGHITNDTIGSLVDKAIAYLQELSPPKWTIDIGLNRTQSAAIQSYLDLEDNDNAEGDLNRYIDPDQRSFWMCQPHICQFFPQGSLETLKEFVRGQGGLVNMQKAKLKVELNSTAEADQFRTLLISTSHIFDISIKLNWQATSSYVEALCEDIAKSKAVVLELDGITLDIQPQDYVKSSQNIFANHIFSRPGVKFVTLLNYPRRQEQCIHLRQFSLQSKLAPVISTHSWSALRSDLERFNNQVYAAQLADSNCHLAATELRAALETHGILDASTVTFYGRHWDGIFDLKKGIFVEVQSLDLACPMAVFSSGTLQRLTLDLYDMDFDEELIRMVKANTNLQELNISYYGQDIFRDIELVARMWRAVPGSIHLTLLDRVAETQGRVVAQLAIRRRDKDVSACTTMDIQEKDTNRTCQQQDLFDDADFKFTQWKCDHIFSRLSDRAASVLDMASQEHPSVLTFFTLDISQLSCIGLVSVQNVLQRSSLEHLNIMCTTFDPSLSDSITQVLGSVSWPTIKSLVLSGDKIDEWLQLWPSTTAARLLYLTLQGQGPRAQELSHSSALFIHQQLYGIALAELTIENVQFEDGHDWDFIVENIDAPMSNLFDLE